MPMTGFDPVASVLCSKILSTLRRRILKPNWFFPFIDGFVKNGFDLVSISLIDRYRKVGTN